jgi:site-specific recombinase XerD
VNSKSKVSIEYKAMNIGRKPTFIPCNGDYKKDKLGHRVISFYEDEIITKFPLVVCRTRVRECLEMNLFLIHRVQGKYAIKRNKNQRSPATSEGYLASLKGEGVSIDYADSLAKDLQAFLIFLIKGGYLYEQVIAAPLSKDSAKDAVASLPIWKYLKHLIERHKSKGSDHLSFNLAYRRINTVRHFYQWSYTRGTITHLPFSLSLEKLKSTSPKAQVTFFTMPKPKGSLDNMDWVSNLTISKAHKQADDVSRELQPYSPLELVQLLSTDTAKHPTYSLFFKCAYLAGFRSFEIPQIRDSEIVNPKLDKLKGKHKVYKVSILRKGFKPIRVNVGAKLMEQLYAYTQTDQWVKRAKKFQIKYGKDEPLPVFINQRGDRMVNGACGSAIREVRREQRNEGLPVLERDFHDLRASFGTYLAIQMVLDGVSEERIKETLKKLFSHENFKTTNDYLNFAKVLISETDASDLNMWIDGMYSTVDKMLQEAELLMKKDESRNESTQP